MALLYAKPVEYAIRALTQLATHEGEGTVTVQDIAQAEGISAHHLSKVMKSLAQHKLVSSLRGPGGGYALSVDPKEINLWRVLVCFSIEDQFEACVLGDSECSDENPCTLHDRWCPVKERIRKYFQEVTISELAETACKKGKPPLPRRVSGIISDSQVISTFKAGPLEP